MIENKILTNEDFSEYFLKTFPGFDIFKTQGNNLFYNSDLDFFAIPYFGKLNVGIDLTNFRDIPDISPSVSLLSLYNFNGTNSFCNRFINSSLLSKYVKNRRLNAEKEDSPIILTRPDICDLFSGRGRDEVFLAVNFRNRYVPSVYVSGTPVLKDMLLSPSQDSRAIDYITRNNLI